MAFAAITYPEWRRERDFEWIQEYRQAHDELFFNVIQPHFTLVFPVFDMTEEAFREEIRQRAEGCEAFDFTLRCAVINRDAFRPYYHVFLVPEEGYSKVVKLHDRLYGGSLLPELRLDIDYVPHIGMANNPEPLTCKRWVDEMNRADLAIEGRVKRIDIIRWEGKQVQTLEKISMVD